MGRTLIKVSTSEHCIILRTISRDGKSRRFYLTREEFSELEYRPEIITRDGWSFAVLRRDTGKDTLSVEFTWLSGGNSHVHGHEESVMICFSKLAAFVRDNANEGAEYKALSMDYRVHRPRLVFTGKENLHAAVNNGTVRRKLARALRDNFHWPDAEKIEFFNDFIPYSFFFQEIYNGQPVMCGGLILHGQDDMRTAYYGLHT